MYCRIRFIIIIALAISSCTKEQFSVNRDKTSSTTDPITKSINGSCSSFTLTRPKVDFLFLWDNSTSTNFINNQTKAALNNTIDLISNRFDYHILLAPLLGSGNSYAKLISSTPVGLGASALAIKIDRSLASATLSTFPLITGDTEAGVQRSIDLISANRSNGIFREKSYLIIIVMSNQDDNSWVQGAYPTGVDRSNYINTKYIELLCLRGNYQGCGTGLDSLQMRFFSIVAHEDTCNGTQPQWKAGGVYKEMSEKIYQTPYNNGNPSPSDGFPPFDSYNICSPASFLNIFNGINNSIQGTIIKHKYNYWPVAGSGAGPIDPNEVKVLKNGVEQMLLQEPVPPSANGFSFTNSIQTVNTRYAPTSGESYTGYVVKLYGNARVVYPECMVVKTQAPKEYFGFIAIDGKPFESSIEVTINDQKIPQGGANGWELLKSNGSPKYFESKNIRITGPNKFCPSNSTDYCPAPPSPQYLKSGYILKVKGTAVYSNGAVIEVTYDPAN